VEYLLLLLLFVKLENQMVSAKAFSILLMGLGAWVPRVPHLQSGFSG